MNPDTLRIQHLGTTSYETAWHAMQDFTASRTPDTPDEIWVTEHFPVYTLGLNRRNVRLPLRQDIPLVMVDRGGKITYHGPGQLVIYLLIDMKRMGISIRQLVSSMEDAIIALLSEHAVMAEARQDAPGVYVDGKKIASLGLRVKNNCSYHGLSFNIDMDLTPFDAIDPCGYEGLQVTQVRDLGITEQAAAISHRLLEHLTSRLTNGYLEKTIA